MSKANQLGYVLALFQAAAGAQTVVSPAAPSPSHERLSMFEGEWTVESTSLESFREICAWQEGRRHLVCRATWRSAGQPREGLSVFSYDAATNDYLYHSFRPGGSVVPLKGSLADDTWTFASGPATTRVVIRPAPDGFTLAEEAINPQGAWAERSRTRFVRLRK